MGFFDNWVKVIDGIINGNKVSSKKYFDTDEQAFIDSIPTGQIFVGLTADRFVDPFDKSQPLLERLTDALRGAIRSFGNSYWQHAIIGKKNESGEVEIIEAIAPKITKRKLSVYFEPKNQLKLFFPPLTHKQSLEIWRRAESKVGLKYDFLELYDKVSIFGKLGIFFGNKKSPVCHALAQWSFKIYFNVLNPKLTYRERSPGSINQWLQPNPDVKIIVYNLDPRQHN